MASRKIAKWAVWSIVLAGGTVLLHAQKKGGGGASHSAPAAHEHSAAPQKQEHAPTAPPKQEHATPPVRGHSSPAPEHPSAHSQGRTFGNHPPQTTRVPNSGARPALLNPAPAHSGGTVAERSAVHSVATPHVDSIQRSPGGQAREVHLPGGATVYHAPGGPRRVELARPDGHVVVASAPGHGYVQRPIVAGNAAIIKRTYIQNGVRVARFYQPRMFNGVPLFVYRPWRYYRPAFYWWAYNPWPQPAVYMWGWARAPWYGYYSGYFSPYPMYDSPSLWLTDYLIAATLESAYQERLAASSRPTNDYAGGQPIAPETKQLIADEVRRQIDVLRAEQDQVSSSGVRTATIFSDNAQHVFVANTSYLYNSNADECTISEGDVLSMTGAPPANASSADVMVLSSRGRDCARGSTVSVPLRDLQEMHNAMMATVDRGLGEMQAKQGQDGIPALPPESTGTIDSPYAAEAQPDENVAGELDTLIQQTDRAEQKAIAASTELTFGTAVLKPALTMGISIDQAKAIQGEPERIVEMWSRKILVYKDLRITFTNGRLTDIE